MNLAIASMISGAGNAAKESIGEQAKFNLMRELENSRQEMENMRQDRNLAAQRAMHTESIEAHAKEGRLTREHADLLADKHGTLLKELDRIKGERDEAIAGQHISSAESIAELNRMSQERIHDADRVLKKYEIEETSKAHTQSTYSKALTEIGYEITRLNAIVKDPMADKNSPEYKDVTARLKKLTTLYDRYSTALAPAGSKEEATPARPAFKNPFQSSSAKPAPPANAQASIMNPAPGRAPGSTFTVPMPGTDEQEMMRRSIEQE